MRWVLLLAASLGFYATFRASYVLLLIAVTAVAYLAGLAIGASPAPGKRKALLIAGNVLLVGILAACKYFDFLAQSAEAVLAGATGSAIGLPRTGLIAVAGLSFYVFSCVSYVADVYAG